MIPRGFIAASLIDSVVTHFPLSYSPGDTGSHPHCFSHLAVQPQTQATKDV